MDVEGPTQTPAPLSPATPDDEHPITDVSFRLIAACLVICVGVYILTGLWSVRRLVVSKAPRAEDGSQRRVFEPRWLLLPLALGAFGCVWTAIVVFPTALAIGLVYTSTDTVIAADSHFISSSSHVIACALPISITVIFMAFGTVKLQYSM